MNPIYSLFSNDRSPLGVTAICSSVLAAPLSLGPIGGFVYGAASAVSFSLGEKLAEKIPYPSDPIVYTATKTLVAVIPLIFGALGGWAAATALCFKFSFSNILFLGAATPICVKVVLSIIDLFILVYQNAGSQDGFVTRRRDPWEL